MVFRREYRATGQRVFYEELVTSVLLSMSLIHIDIRFLSRTSTFIFATSSLLKSGEAIQKLFSLKPIPSGSFFLVCLAVKYTTMNTLHLPRWCNVQQLSEKDIGVVAVSNIPAGTRFGPCHGIPNVLDKAREQRKVSYLIEVYYFKYFFHTVNDRTKGWHIKKEIIVLILDSMKITRLDGLNSRKFRKFHWVVRGVHCVFKAKIVIQSCRFNSHSPL